VVRGDRLPLPGYFPVTRILPGFGGEKLLVTISAINRVD